MKTREQILERLFHLSSHSHNVINFGIGEPDFDTPQPIIDSAKKALDDGYTHYTPNQGYAELRAAIAEKYEKKLGMLINPDRVIVTVGGSEALFATFLGSFSQPDEVLVPDPGFFLYSGMLNQLRIKTVPYPLLPEKNFHPDVEMLKKLRTENTKGIVLNSPSNPTGTIIPRQTMREITEWATENNILIISDETYDSIVYPGFAYSPAATSPEILANTVIINSFSKKYAMTGWRIGYLIAPEKQFRPIFDAHLNMVACVSAFVQKAAVGAIRNAQSSADDMFQELCLRREIMMNGLSGIQDFDFSVPEGAFYLMLNIEKYGLSSLEIAEKLISEYGIVTMPGEIFGQQSEKFLRLSFAISQEKIREGCKRLAQFAEDHQA